MSPSEMNFIAKPLSSRSFYNASIIMKVMTNKIKNGMSMKSLGKTTAGCSIFSQNYHIKEEDY